MKSAGTLASLLLCGALLAGCSDDGGDPETPEPTDGASSSASPAAQEPEQEGVPEGTELTPEGTDLVLGDEAVVSYEPRQETVGVLEVSVTRIERTTFRASFAGWQLGASTKRTTPYFVRATLTNAGETDLGGRQVPLYGVDSKDMLVEASTFKGRFKPCPSRPFPKAFAPGATHEACLVYLAPAGTTLAAVSFRPTQEYVPITWTGPVSKVRPVKRKPRP
ncbi:hypothetical protein [Nocardioides lijunqiniae]|uniref:hypothetical protein n=1 Tax=Nocardioides lijunqiniae TaxID=2760832 RepID=UPI0018776F5B|nr:hypothetical protein [Nocardioides lijunqiniae]